MKIIRLKSKTIIFYKGKDYHFTDGAKNLSDKELIKRCKLSKRCDDILSIACS